MTKSKKTTAGDSTPAVTPKVETPVVETPVVETPVVETPVVETPVVETPVVETPVVETPVVETAVVDNSDDSEAFFVYGEKHYTLQHYVKKLQFNGVIYPRKKILTNDEIMTTLIVGNSPFIKKL